MPKQILLVEPAYKTKYPPLGLMKLAAYHKIKGDYVKFVKGCNKEAGSQYWDRIYITTLFTYTWNETVKTINFYQDNLFGIAGKIFVGGILASLMPQELQDATGIYPVVGLLNDCRKIKQEDGVNIDALPPDYSILSEVEFPYAHTNAYIGYATRGCPKRCDFCAVNKFEPRYINYIDIKNWIREIDKNNANTKKQNLILMDNNVLYSNRFSRIINDILDLGFQKGAILNKKKRIVDFNQGLDASLLIANKNKMRLLSKIALEPMRLGFDNISYKKKYVEAVKLAHDYGQIDLSNYILYNHKDTPKDFYERLKINIDLNVKFSNNKNCNTNIYSFPMRYIPLDAKKRGVYIGKYWNKRYLRSIQCITNVVHGSVMPGSDFFYQAFGKDLEEFYSILLMPDSFIFNRCNGKRKDMPYVAQWKRRYKKLIKSEKRELIKLLGDNNRKEFPALFKSTKNGKLRKMIECHIEADKIVESYKSNESKK